MHNQFGHSSVSTMESVHFEKQEMTADEVKIALGLSHSKVRDYEEVMKSSVVIIQAKQQRRQSDINAQTRRKIKEIKAQAEKRISDIQAEAQLLITYAKIQAKQKVHEAEQIMREKIRVEIAKREMLEKLNEEFREKQRKKKAEFLFQLEMSKKIVMPEAPPNRFEARQTIKWLERYLERAQASSPRVCRGTKEIWTTKET